jgi:glycerophosphoryl diester phosphodiesterase
VAGKALKISELTFRELSEIVLENGSKVPRLEEVLAAFPDLKMNLDIKSFGAILPTVAVLERLQAHHRVLVSSFSLRRRKQAVRLLSRPVATSASAPEVLALWVSHRIGGIGFGRIARELDALQIPLRQGPVNLSGAGFIRRLRKHNVEVHYWTVNDPVLAKQLIDSGATGIVSDRVDLIRF